MVHNSREALKMRISSKADGDKPSSSSRGRGLILETPYKPGFVDDKDLETVKMAVDKELDDISNAFYETIERTADTITRVDKLEITGDTQYGELKASIERVDRVSKEGDVALAETITTWTADVNNEFGKVNASIQETNRVMASEDKLLAEKIDSIVGSFEGELGPLFAQIDEVRQISITGDEALATSINETVVKFQQADSTLQAGIKTEETSRVTADTALGKRIDVVSAEIVTGDNKVSASVTAEQQARVTADNALASDIRKVEAAYKAGDTTLSGQISNEASVRANQDGVLSKNITDVKAEVNGSIANVRQYAEAEISRVNGAVTAINAKWGVQVNVNGKISGIQLNNDGRSSHFSVVADRFTISDGASDASVFPFAVVGGNTRIRSLYVEQLRSDNWNGSNVGWAITKDGYANFQGVTVRGNIFADSGEFNNVRINENCLILGTLYADRIVGLPTGKSFGPSDINLVGGGWRDLYSTTVTSAQGRFNTAGLVTINSSSSGYDDGNASYAPAYRVLVNGSQVAFFYTGLPSYNIDRYSDTSGSSGKFIVGSGGGTVTVQYGVVSISRSGTVTFINHTIGRDFARVRGQRGFLYTAIDK